MMKRGGPLRRTTPLRSNTKLRVVGDSDRTTILSNIQALLRELAILRDGGCVMRYYAEAGACGGCNKSGELMQLRDPQL